MPDPQTIPQLGITTGDPAGVGPEISLLAARERSFPRACRMILFGSWDLLRSRASDVGIPFEFERTTVRDLAEGRADLADRCIVDVPSGRIETGIGSRESGAAAARNILECVPLCSSGVLHAMVTAPLNKKHFQEAGYLFPGHTEFLAHLSGASEIAMAFLTERLKVVLATIHISLREVLQSLTSECVYRKLRLTLAEFRRLGLPCARVAVAGINPHAGESGLMGNEDTETILPALELARGEFPETAIRGPLPADTLFWRAYNGEFDVVLAMYHDQGLGPVKLIGFGESVNVTLGLPFIRTSVDHGTAFDIAGKGIARADSMNSAIRWALRLAAGRA